MNLALFVVVFITGITLVAAAMAIAGLISPRSFNSQKGEALSVVFLLGEPLGCSLKQGIICLQSFS